jgi:hypothetical protein
MTGAMMLVRCDYVVPTEKHFIDAGAVEISETALAAQ